MLFLFSPESSKGKKMKEALGILGGFEHKNPNAM